MDISIIIVNYNVREYIISCIESIYKHTNSKINYEIIVVDNNSSDKSVEALERKFPKVIIIKNDYNAQFSTAVNQGEKLSSGRYIFILNPDTLFIEDSCSEILSSIKNLKQFGGIGPKIISQNGKTIRSYWKFPTLLNTVMSLLHLDFLNFNKNYFNFNLKNTSIVHSISGGAFFIPKRIFFKVGGFNKNLFWMEDIDLCLKINKINYHIYHTKSTKIIHYIGKSAQKNLDVAITNQLISKIKYFRTNHSFFQSQIIKIFVLIVSLVKSLLFLILYPLSIKHKKKFFAYSNAFYTTLMNKF